MTTNTIGNVGSVAKTITATAIMQLWEQHLIQLDADINTYLPFSVRNPHFPEAPITIEQLLTHTSSIIDNKSYDQGYACGDSDIPLTSWLTTYFDHAEDAFGQDIPGSNHNYSNVGYGLLGAIVEGVSKKAFNDYCKEYIFTPLEMNQTGWFLHEVDTENHMTPYLFAPKEDLKDIPEGFQKLLMDPELKPNENNALCFYGFPNYPDGLLRTNLNDLSNFLIAMLNGGSYSGRQILKKETVALMLSPSSIDHRQGLGWRYTGMENIWGHGGDDPGIQAGIYFNPDVKIGMISLKNSNAGSRTEILRELYLTAKSTR